MAKFALFACAVITGYAIGTFNWLVVGLGWTLCVWLLLERGDPFAVDQEDLDVPEWVNGTSDQA